MADNIEAHYRAAWPPESEWRGRYGPRIERELKPRPLFGFIGALLIILGAVAGAALIVLAFLMLLAATGKALAEESYHSNPWLLSWIPAPCCVTNDCCWQISEREVEPIDGEAWRIRATGQEIARSGWSPDGKFYRCACDFNGSGQGNTWVRHQGAWTRCLFVPLRAAEVGSR